MWQRYLVFGVIDGHYALRAPLALRASLIVAFGHTR
jgi:hypothetical protein